MTRFLRPAGLAAAFCLTLVVAAGSASAVELEYRWKKGKTYRFKTTTQQVVDMKAAGMDMQAKFNGESVFALHVDKVDRAGTAHGVLAIERFEAKTADGRVLAGIGALPKRALVNLVSIDKKGVFAFKEIVYLLVPEQGGAVLASAQVGPNGVSGTASGTIGNEQHTVYAQFDAKTGRLSAGYSVKKLKPKKKRIATLRNASRVDLVPFEFLSMLRLPDGDVTAGTKATMKAAGYEIALTASAADAKTARLKTLISTPGGKGTSATVTGPGGGGMGVQMPDMGDMMGGGGGMGGMGGPPGMGNPSSMLKLDGDFVQDFDVKKGMLAGISGWITSSMAAGPMKVASTATITLTPMK